MVEVCCAIILNESRILTVQRGEESIHSLGWEFPGGKINENETAEQCILREIEEELSVQIDALTQLMPIEYEYSTKKIRLIPFLCQIVSGEINLTEHVAKRWINKDELGSVNWLEADRELINENNELLNIMMALSN